MFPREATKNKSKNHSVTIRKTGEKFGDWQVNITVFLVKKMRRLPERGHLLGLAWY